MYILRMQAIKEHMDLTTTYEYTKPIWTEPN